MSQLCRPVRVPNTRVSVRALSRKTSWGRPVGTGLGHSSLAPWLPWPLVSENGGCAPHEDGLPSLLAAFPLLCGPGEAGPAGIPSSWTAGSEYLAALSLAPMQSGDGWVLSAHICSWSLGSCCSSSYLLILKVSLTTWAPPKGSRHGAAL